MRFKVGDIVKISSQCSFFEGSSNKNIEGTIDEINEGHLPIKVSWNNNDWNLYNEKELKLVRRNIC